MEITCPRCQSMHDIALPPGARARGARSLKFRCSHCGHTFAVDPGVKEFTHPPLLGEKADGESVQLLQVAGQIWSVPDMAALHKWILERRLDRDSLVSKHGLRWERAGDRTDLAVFFSASDALSFHERNYRTEIPLREDEIVVDAHQADSLADEDDAFDPNLVENLRRGRRMPVATGPGPAVNLHPSVLGGLTELDAVDDTQETLDDSGLDETPIQAEPAPLDAPGAAGERTERLPDGSIGVHRIPLPTGISTVTPGPAPVGSAALGNTFGSGVAAAALPDPAAGVPAPLRVVTSSANPGPTPVTQSVATTVPSGLRTVSPVLHHAGAQPKDAQISFFDGTHAAGPPGRDVFDDPPSNAGGGGRLALLGGLGVAAALAAIAIVSMTMMNGGEVPRADTIASAAGAPVPAIVPVPAVAAVPPADVPPPPADVPPPPADAPVAKVPEETSGAGAVSAPAVAPAPATPVATVKAPAPQPGPASTGTSSKRLVEQGWQAVEEGDYDKAHGFFDRAMKGGSPPDALYGRGYANEKLGDSTSATNDYCRVLGTSSLSIDLRREVEGGLRRLGRSCS